jgi:quinol monooxygenase YgiN
MRAGYYERNGPARDVLRVAEVDKPTPGPRQVRIKIKTSGVNPSDVKAREGRTRKLAYPRVIPHSDGAGEIDMVGEGVLGNNTLINNVALTLPSTTSPPPMRPWNPARSWAMSSPCEDGASENSGRTLMLRLLALAGLVVTALGSPALAQNAALFTVTYIEVGPVLTKVSASALHAYRESGRKDQGAASLDVYQRVERPNQFVVLGTWADQKDFEAHLAGDSNAKLNEKLSTMLAAPVDVRQHGALSVAPAKPAKDAIVVVTHLDVLPPEKDNGANALEQLADDSRRHSGNVRFDVWRQSDRPNHFSVVEAWANRGAFDVHQMQKETREFRNRLGPMSGSLYDERLYKPLP